MRIRRIGLSLLLLALGPPAGAQGPQTLDPRRTGQELSPLDYGAACDGRTDDAAALQATLDAAIARPGNHAIVRMPATLCATATRLTLNGTDKATHVDILGISPINSGFVWTGSTARVQPVLAISRNTHFALRGIGFYNGAASRGSIDGLWLTGPGTNGTQTYSGIVERCLFTKFHRGVVASPEAGRDSSEMVWIQNGYAQNDIGWHMDGFNTLNHVHIMPSFNANAIGMFVNSSGQGVSVLGGSASGSTAADFDINGFGTTTIANFRSETAERVLVNSVPFIETNITLDGVETRAPANPDQKAIVARAGQLRIVNSKLHGYVEIVGRDARGYVTMENNRLLSSAAGLPVSVSTGAYAGDWIELSLRQNQGMDSQANRMFADFAGRWSAQGGFQPTMQGVTSPDGHRELGATFQAVRSLGFGTVTPGANLRDTVTFAGRGTATYTFRRTVTVTLAANGTFTVTSGALKPADLGKRVVVTNGSNDCGYAGGRGRGSFVAHIAAYADPAHGALSVNQKLSTDDCRPNALGGQSGVSMTIGQDEPDANYFVFPGVYGATPKAVSFSNFTAAGFTVHIDDPASTATVGFLLVR